MYEEILERVRHELQGIFGRAGWDVQGEVVGAIAHNGTYFYDVSR